MEFNRMSFLCFPSDMNPMGTLFGGIVMQRIDLCAAITARQVLYHSKVPGILCATRHVDAVDFRVPAKSGDLLLLTGKLISLGKSSIVIEVIIEREDTKGVHMVLTTARVTMVSIRPFSVEKVNHGLTFDPNTGVISSES